MRAIVNLILRAANLAEAEGRIARQNVFELAVAVVLVAAATVLLVCGVLAGGLALVLGLREFMHPSLAVAIVSLMLVACAAVLAVLLRRSLRERWVKKP